jgi:hypothetical protein
MTNILSSKAWRFLTLCVLTVPMSCVRAADVPKSSPPPQTMEEALATITTHVNASSGYSDTAHATRRPEWKRTESETFQVTGSDAKAKTISMVSTRTLATTRDASGKFRREVKSSFEYVIPLAELSPKTELSPLERRNDPRMTHEGETKPVFYVVVSTLNDKPLIQSKEKSEVTSAGRTPVATPAESAEKISSVRIAFLDRQIAEQVRKAFDLAVNLASGNALSVPAPQEKLPPNTTLKPSRNKPRESKATRLKSPPRQRATPGKTPAGQPGAAGAPTPPGVAPAAPARPAGADGAGATPNTAATPKP